MRKQKKTTTNHFRKRFVLIDPIDWMVLILCRRRRQVVCASKIFMTYTWLMFPCGSWLMTQRWDGSLNDNVIYSLPLHFYHVSVLISVRQQCLQAEMKEVKLVNPRHATKFCLVSSIFNLARCQASIAEITKFYLVLCRCWFVVRKNKNMT
jgi:hypothetical protein